MIDMLLILRLSILESLELLEDTHTCQLGVVIRNEHGRFLVACNNPISYEIGANTADARVVSRGIALANEVG
jgi:hypothetical protein